MTIDLINTLINSHPYMKQFKNILFLSFGFMMTFLNFRKSETILNNDNFSLVAALEDQGIVIDEARADGTECHRCGASL